MSLNNPTPILSLERQADGSNSNTWNDRFNAQWLRVEMAITGAATVNVTSGTVTLTYVDSTDLAADAQTRAHTVFITGTPSAPTTLILQTALPGKTFIVQNNTSQPCTFKVYGGSGITIISGVTRFLWCLADIVEVLTECNLYAIQLMNFAPTGTFFNIPIGTSPISASQPGVAFFPQQTEIYSDGVTNTPLRIGASGASGAQIVQFFAGGSLTGNIAYTGSGIVLNTTSDYRLKVSFGLADVGATIDAVPVHDAMFRKDENQRRRPMFMAHELEAHAPWAVWGKKDAVDDQGEVAPQMVDYAGLVPLLWAEVQSLRRRVAALETA